MTVIRVGLIGLAATDVHNPMGAWGVFAHLRSIQALSDDFELVAVANSTTESARRSIEFHKLPASVKAYGSPNDIAADPNVDLIVVSVDVTKHFKLTLPALEHKKSVFVEWPLGANVEEAEKMTKLALDNGVKAMVGVQGRFDHSTQKVKEILATGKIGKITSSTVTISSRIFPMDQWFKGAERFLDLDSGGNELTIIFGHFLDSFIYLLGDFVEVQSTLKSHYNPIRIVDPSSGEVVGEHVKTVPDHIFVQGVLESGALASLAYRKPGASPEDHSGIRWYISGTEGEILITTNERPWQSLSTPANRSIKVTVGDQTEAEVIDFAPANDLLAAQVPSPGTNTARLYEAFAHGKEIATFESALKTHRLLERIVKAGGLSLNKR